jgi:deoxycytidylate deaminase
MTYDYDWGELAFASKKPIRELNATFIAAPRELSAERFKQLLKQNLPKGNIILGLAKEDYVEGFDGQPQFRMLKVTGLRPIIDKVNASAQPGKVYTLTYFQRELQYILEKIDFPRVVLVNGSWKHMFHTQAAYYTMASKHIPYDMVTPFADEAEAHAFEASVMPQIEQNHPFRPGNYDALAMMGIAAEASYYSFDYGFQTGVALGKKSKKNDQYTLLGWAYNRVVPFQTYAMHYGASRETNFSPPNDLNHYDTVHAEVEMLIKTGKEQIDLNGTALFINLLPCPACARMFTQTDIAEFIYREDHSDGYAVKMLEQAGKTVRRIA